MEPQIEYATTSDGVRIATFAMGEGTPLLIAATPPWSHVEREMRIPAVGAWIRELAQEFRVVRYDCRGTGLSDRDRFDLAPDAQVRDMEAVVSHFSLDSFAIWGTIGGSPASIVYTARYPDRVTHLLLWGAYATGATLLHKPGFRSMAAVLKDNWQLYTDMFAQVGFGWPDSNTASEYADLMRQSMTQETMLLSIEQLSALDVTADARQIRTPTLVLTRRGATISGIAEARELAALIPSARLAIIEGSSHAPFLENPELVTGAIRAFVASDPEVRAPAPPPVQLTDREHQVLRRLANGRTGKEIAADLGISLPTVQRHIANIYAKIGVRGRVEAAAYAFEHRLVRHGDSGPGDSGPT